MSDSGMSCPRCKKPLIVSDPGIRKTLTEDESSVSETGSCGRCGSCGYRWGGILNRCRALNTNGLQCQGSQQYRGPGAYVDETYPFCARHMKYIRVQRVFRTIDDDAATKYRPFPKESQP